VRFTGIAAPVVLNSGKDSSQLGGNEPNAGPAASGGSLAPPISVAPRTQGSAPAYRRPPRGGRAALGGAPAQANQAPAPEQAAQQDDEIPHLRPHPDPEARILSPARYHLIAQYHGQANPHQGVEPLLAALREDGHVWQGMEADCRSFIVRCHHCQLERLNRRGAAALPYRSVLLPSRLFEVWNFDIIGPLQICGLTGSRYIYVGIEETSKFLMLGHSNAISAMDILFFLLDCFKIFGLPLIIKSDLGVQFISAIVRLFCQCTGITQKFGVAHRHESDGVVEIGVRQVWQYLRLAVHDLRKYDAWTPLLCNVQLGCNSLTRDVLGGAAASTLVFNRKVKPMRFLRPDSPLLTEDAYSSIPTFIADNAAAQLDLLHRADVTRTNRFADLRDSAEGERARAEEEQELRKLDWVRVGISVSIPQPEAQSRLRPEKMSLRRRGPYVVLECDPAETTVILRDKTYPARPTFRWPKELLWPYHPDSLPALPEPQQLDDQEAPELPIVCDVECANAIIKCRRLTRPVIPNAPLHVRNQEYLVRWTGRPHYDVTWASYNSIWATFAFQEFIIDSNLTGHVPPAAYTLAHRRHVQQLLSGTAAPDRMVPIAAPTHVERMIQYFPSEMPRKPNKKALRISLSQAERQQEFESDDD
jgi:hypothetical protein